MTDPPGRTLSTFVEAIDAGDADRVDALLASDASLAAAHDGDGVSATMHALYRGRRTIAESIAAALPELDVFEAAALGRVDRLRALLAAGADVNARSDNAISVLPLHSAVAGGHDDVVAVLVDAGADVNAVQVHGWTPIHGAAKTGSLVSVERLLTAGADPTARNDDGTTAIELARAGGHDAIVARLSG